MFSWARPYPVLNDAQTAVGLREFFKDGLAFQVFYTLTTAPLFVAFARLIQPSDLFLGLLVAVPPACQLLQPLTVLLVERLRNRKLIVVFGSLAGRLPWLFIPLIPLLPGTTLQMGVLLFSQLWCYAFYNVAGCAMNTWARDFVPEKIVGAYFGRRFAWSATAAALILAGTLFLLPKETAAPTTQFLTFGGCFVFAALLGLLSCRFLARIPEPVYAAPPAPSIFRQLAAPLHSVRFRRVLCFTVVWQLTFGMSWQFYTKHMLDNLGLSLSLVTTVTIFSMLLNALFYPLWGKIADRVGNASVLALTIPLHLVGLLLWQGSAIWQTPAFNLGLAALVFLLGGITFAGNQLCVFSLVLKAAPRGGAAPFFACNAVLMGISSALSPVLGGVIADWADAKGIFSGQKSHSLLGLPGLNQTFLVALGFGLLALFFLHRLAPREFLAGRWAAWRQLRQIATTALRFQSDK